METQQLKWLVFGCGGVGGYFGARLAQQGQRVGFMVRNKTLHALQTTGVQLNSICGDATVSPQQLGPVIDTGNLSASPPAKRGAEEEAFEADVILLCCKAWEAERCLEMCRPWCGSSTLVLPLQNGVEGFNKAKSVVAGWGKGRVLAGCCNIVSAIQDAGQIRHWAADPPYITFGELERCHSHCVRDTLGWRRAHTPVWSALVRHGRAFSVNTRARVSGVNARAPRRHGGSSNDVVCCCWQG